MALNSCSLSPSHGHMRPEVFRTSGSTHLGCIRRGIVNRPVLYDPFADEKHSEEGDHDDDGEYLPLKDVGEQSISAVPGGQFSSRDVVRVGMQSAYT